MLANVSPVRFGSKISNPVINAPLPTHKELADGEKNGLYISKNILTNEGGCLKVYAETPKLIKQKDKDSKLFSGAYYIVENGKVTYERAHDYEKLYRWGGQIYDFYVHEHLQYASHRELAKTVSNLTQRLKLPDKKVRLLEVGAGHGTVLKEIKDKGHQYNTMALDISKAAKEAHDSPFIKYKYGEYLLGFISKNMDIKRKVKEFSPNIVMLASTSAHDGIEPDFLETLKCLEPEGHVIVNIPVEQWNNYSTPVSKLLKSLIDENKLKLVEMPWEYTHRKLANGVNQQYYMIVAKKIEDIC